jgi:hypothetical protein
MVGDWSKDIRIPRGMSPMMRPGCFDWSLILQVYETLLYLLTPFILPISFYVRPSFCGILLGSTIVMYLLNVVIFNEIHLRRKNERLGWVLLYVYYLPYKIVLTCINVASCYW